MPLCKTAWLNSAYFFRAQKYEKNEFQCKLIVFLRPDFEPCPEEGKNVSGMAFAGWENLSEHNIYGGFLWKNVILVQLQC